MFVLKQNGMKERQLYDYQLDMKRRVGEAFGSHRSVMVQMPTGTGKTCVLVACVVVAERGDGVDRGAPQGTGGTDRRDAAGGGSRGRPGTGLFHPVVVSARGGTGGETGPAGDR